jgi:MFS family permease
MSSTAAAVSVRSRFPAWAVIAALCVGSLSGALMQTLVIPIQNELPALLHTNASNASWAVTATLLAGGVTMPVSGRLADMFGKKKVLATSAGILVVGSVVAAVSSSFIWFLIGRVLQGLAMGYIAVAISMVREVASKQRQAGAVAAVSATMGVGGAIGLPLSAWIAESFSWHDLFWVSAVVGAVVLIVTLVVVPGVRDAHPGHIDIGGIVGLAVGLSLLLAGVSKSSEWGWGSGKTLGSIVIGALVLLVWGWYQLRHHDPIVDLRSTIRRPVLLTNVAALLVGFGMMAQMIVVPQLLELSEATGYGLGQSILQAGLWMAPGGLMMMSFAPVSSALINRLGARSTLAIGATVIAAGYVFALGMMNSPWQLMLASMIVSAGVGIGYAAMPTLIMDNVPAAESGAGVGVNTLTRSIGTTTAGAVMAAILTSATTTIGGHAVPDKTAFQLCFLLCAAVSLVGAAVALFVSRRKTPVEEAESPAAPMAEAH